MRSLAVAVLVGALSACSGQVAALTGGCDAGSRLSVTHGSEGGEATARAAAEGLGTWAADGPLRASVDGWQVVEESTSEVVFRSDDVETTVVRLDDDTWSVDEARCITE